ncbi:(2Fe-2S)-binding protein [Nocardiopsis trehalosi]|jgi:hypothetical protein|uniref:(2Fe-2S)-binding protein n=1 Tax=Nocardiopsis trehalosi TaxID=109329 RepID=UPI000831E7BE|nr:(2Fe-2S)-binding protein [Nocardiopsis trehalosi]
MQTCHPLAGVVRWINERELYLTIDLLGPRDPEPEGDDWVRLDRLPDRVPELIDRLSAGVCQGHRTSAAAFLAGDLGLQVFGTASGIAYLTGRAPDLAAHLVWVRVHESGRLDRLAIRQGTAAVLTGDPMARRPGVVVLPTERDLDLWLARSAAATLDPVTEAVRAHTRFGTRPQWSMMADGPHAVVLAAADEVGFDQSEAWERARRIVELVNHDRPRVVPKQRPFPLALSGRPVHRPERVFLVRGGCCFYYKVGAQKCASCPIATDTDRETQLRTHYEVPAPTA